MTRTSTARTRLVTSASQRIHASSYSAASVEDQCADASVHKGSLYYFDRPSHPISNRLDGSRASFAALPTISTRRWCDVTIIDALAEQTLNLVTGTGLEST